jgi:hypothetical protein
MDTLNSYKFIKEKNQIRKQFPKYRNLDILQEEFEMLKKTNPTKTQSWKDLVGHYKEMKIAHMKIYLLTILTDLKIFH